MTARFPLLVPATLIVLALLTGCASSAPKAQARTAPPPPVPTEIVEGSGTESERAEIQSQDRQIYNAEHGSGSDYPVPQSGTNQDIP
jgi:hypothetical protein